MNEKLIEKKLKAAVKKMGGIALKIYSPFFTGLPDRLILLPGGFIHWVEVKSTGKKLSPRQQIVHPFLTGLGFRTDVVDSPEGLHDLLESITRQLSGHDL